MKDFAECGCHVGATVPFSDNVRRSSSSSSSRGSASRCCRSFGMASHKLLGCALRPNVSASHSLHILSGQGHPHLGGPKPWSCVTEGMEGDVFRSRAEGARCTHVMTKAASGCKAVFCSEACRAGISYCTVTTLRQETSRYECLNRWSTRGRSYLPRCTSIALL